MALQISKPDAHSVDRPVKLGTSTPLMNVCDLAVSFSTRQGSVAVVQGVSFDIAEGETLALVGESGSGKSTTGLALMGLHANAGSARTGGTINLRQKDGTVCDINRLSQREVRRIRGNEVAMIFQDPMSSLNPIYKIESQIIEAINLHEKLSKRAARSRVEELLQSLGIADPKAVMGCYPHQLSGGMRQRVMIAIALACKPRLLIADEPTTALDVTIQAQILDLLQDIQSRSGMSMLFITHNLGVVAEIAQRVLIMYGGRIVEAGPVGQVFDNARMPYTRALLRSLPRLGTIQTHRQLAAIPGSVPSPMDPPGGCYFHPRCSFQLKGLCDVQGPVLEPCGQDHFVACHRWRDVSQGELA